MNFYQLLYFLQIGIHPDYFNSNFNHRNIIIFKIIFNVIGELIC